MASIVLPKGGGDKACCAVGVVCSKNSSGRNATGYTAVHFNDCFTGGNNGATTGESYTNTVTCTKAGKYRIDFISAVVGSDYGASSVTAKGVNIPYEGAEIELSVNDTVEVYAKEGVNVRHSSAVIRISKA